MFGILGIRGKLLIFGAVSWVIIFGIYGTYTYLEKVAQIERLGVMTARALSGQIMADRELYASMVVERALEGGLALSASYDTMEEAIPVHATFIRSPDKDEETVEPYYVDIISNYPINRDKTPKDAFQLEAIKALSSGSETSYYRLEDYNGVFAIRYMVPDFATSRSCVNCHNSHPKSLKKDYRLGNMLGALEVVVPIEVERDGVMADVWRSIGYGFVVICGMGLAGLAFLSHVVTSRIRGLAETTKYLATGDLTREADITSTDEIGELGKGTNEVIRNLNSMIENIRTSSDQAGDIAASVRVLSRNVVEGSYAQSTSLDSVTSGMEMINSSIAEIAKGAGVLAASTERGSTSVHGLGRSIAGVAGNMETLFSNVNETAISTAEMSESIREVSENIENLSSAIKQVSSSMSDIGAMITDVESNAEEASRIAEDVMDDAKTGMEAVDRTIYGIERTREITVEATGVIRSLSERVMEIGTIFDVIRNVSEETNLLALNAAIIATKAGESGKSFSVVAGEITELAERTSMSTKEVSKIIEAVQFESRRAAIAMEKGLVSVEEGTALSMEAGEALKKIVESAERSTDRVHEIARASAEQSVESRKVVESAERVAETAARIVNATKEQARGGEHINQTTIRMKDISLNVKDATREQVEANKKISMTLDDVNQMVTHINAAILEQSDGSAKILNLIEAVKEVSRKNKDKARETEEAVETLAKLNKALMESVRKFKLKG
ncbi:MAG: methyl-accepting chemotaxis protein [Thermodesulfobacteriota bacterium]